MSLELTPFQDERVADSTTSLRQPWRERLTSWEWLLGIFAVLLIVLAVVTVEGFASDYNLESSMSRMAAKALLVLPLVFLIIAREIDISVASVAGLSGIIFGLGYQAGMSPWLCLLFAFVLGAACGLFNGFLVTRLGLPSLVVTLGTLALFRGLCYVLVDNGQPISPLPTGLIDFVNDAVPATFVPMVMVPFVVLAIVAWVILHHTVFGRRVYTMGGNPDTARYSGVRSGRIMVTLFVASGIVATLAGVLQSGLTSSATPDGLLGFELDAVTIVFLGGVSFLGGRGRITGVIWALIVVIVVRSMLQLRNVSAYEQAAVVGLILIGSLLLANVVEQINAQRPKRTVASVGASAGDQTTNTNDSPNNNSAT